MRLYEIYISYVSWGKDGKRRPVLVFELTSGVASVYSVTSQYTQKSKSIKAKYFEIKDWKQAGLDKPSYVDALSYFDIPLPNLRNKTPIGELTETDKQRLIEFLTT